MKRIWFLSLWVSLLACNADYRMDDPIPFQSFPDIEFSINLPQYNALQSNGGYVVIPYGAIQAGIRGIIIYRENATT
ncbi:MAG TPA: hypothetical protein VFM90_09430, partial [Cyclobacteriaceae bacterium]|nr:hypothetical protein [Cyclobacteriaceae bacterium]